MKRLLVVTLSFTVIFCKAQSYLESMKAYQDTLNAEFKDPETSPLKHKDLQVFESLDFYPVDSTYRVTAKINRTPNSKTFKMKTTTSRTSLSSKWADLEFSIDGELFSLEVYQDLALTKTEEYKDYLFLPFLDDTNGDGSYAGGRYISLYIPEGDLIEIDFNKAYNPYCAYNAKYSCPIVPRKNRIRTRIEAGVKTFRKN